MPLELIPAIHRAAHRIGLLLEEPPHLGVTQGEAHILAHLAVARECTIGELHRAFAHKRSTLTSILDRLESRNLVERHTSPRDRRTFTVRATPRGAKLAARVYRRLRLFEGSVLKQASQAELRAFHKLVARFEDQA